MRINLEVGVEGDGAFAAGGEGSVKRAALLEPFVGCRVVNDTCYLLLNLLFLAG